MIRHRTQVKTQQKDQKDINFALESICHRQGANPGAAGRRVRSLLWLRGERLEASLLFLSWLPHAAYTALSEYF